MDLHLLKSEDDFFQNNSSEESLCSNSDCQNKKAFCGYIELPYCNQNKACMAKCIEHLLLENQKLKGSLESYILQESILSKQKKD